MTKISNKEISYIKFRDKYKEEDYFDIIELDIYYCSDNNPNRRPYRITKVGINEEHELNSPRVDEIRKYTQLWNSSIKNKRYPNDWQLFYLYKEIFQKLIHNKKNSNHYNYFRGQSDSRYILIPGAFRKNVKTDFLRDFEGIYEELARLFPNRLTHYKLEGETIKKRESQLSLLQHFGLKTPLLDITSNPYIAMLFMLSENIESYKEPTLYFFQVGKYADKSEIFVEVVKNEWNDRIIAQRGAFLNFDRAVLNNIDEKIPTLKLVLKFDEKELENSLNFSLQSLLDMKVPKELANSIVKSLREEYEKDESKRMDFIRKELLEKLHEYFYSEADLFPDFEKRIQYISSQYDLDLDLNRQLNVEK